MDIAGKLLESPAWDARLERLIFVDTDGQKIHRFDPSAATDAPKRHVKDELRMILMTMMSVLCGKELLAVQCPTLIKRNSRSSCTT